MAVFAASGTALLKAMERCVLTAYDDATGLPVAVGGHAAGVLSIGWGHTGADVVPGLAWNSARAEAALAGDLAPVIAGLTRAVHAGLTDNEFSALCVLGYNVGLSALLASACPGGTLAAVNNGQFAAVPGHIASWNEGLVAGRRQIIPGLAGRRAAEIALWRLPDGAPAPNFGAIRDSVAAACRAAG